MRPNHWTYLIALLLLTTIPAVADAQENDSVPQTPTHRERLQLATANMSQTDASPTDTIRGGEAVVLLQPTDTVLTATVEIPTERWIPDPKKALWLAIVIPGGGQIYNRKFWKLPLIYGGFMGCMYAISWNNTMYHDYAQAFMDIMDDDPNTKSYENFLPTTYDVNANLDRLQTLFRKKKDYYRRYRDLSIFCAIGVYALSVLDAYIDAELSSFDISRDLSMKIRPSVINDRATAMRNGNSYGLKCALTF